MSSKKTYQFLSNDLKIIQQYFHELIIERAKQEDCSTENKELPKMSNEIQKGRQWYTVSGMSGSFLYYLSERDGKPLLHVEYRAIYFGRQEYEITIAGCTYIKACRTSWKNFPITNPQKIDTFMVLTDDDFLKISCGYIPMEMEEKWFIFLEDDWLYFHRSWTGYGIYKAQLLKGNCFFYIKEFWAERNPEIWTSNDYRDIKIFCDLITDIKQSKK